MTEEPMDVTACRAIAGRLVSFEDRERPEADAIVAAFHAAHPPPVWVKVDESARFHFRPGLACVRMLAYRDPADHGAWMAERRAAREEFRRENPGAFNADGTLSERWLNS